MMMVLCFFGCAGTFTAKERFEGVKDGVVRIYIRCSNDSGYDESDRELNKEILKRGEERLKLLAAQGIIEKKFAEKAAASPIHIRCFDEYCEGFIDYKIRIEEKK